MSGKTYHFGTFVLDRIIYVVTFLVCALILILVISLDVGKVSTGNIIYMFILASFFSLLALVIDYLRQSSFLKQLNRMRQSAYGAELESVLALEEGATYEQNAFRYILESQYRLYMDKLNEQRLIVDGRNLFINQWVHQMKTPVSVIDLLVQQSDQMETVDETGRLLLSVQEENERLAHGLDMMLHQARLEKFEMDVQIKRLDVKELLRFVINGHKQALVRSSIFPQISGPNVYVETDEKWLIFVCSQLVSNAIKYSKIKPGSKKLYIDIEQTDGGYAIRITDEGIGIPEQDLPRIFDPYFTGENGRKTGESTGMGLYLTHEVCRRLGHPINVTSEQGIGTTFTIVFRNKSIHHFTNNK
ncbi:sensor histidine kinase [Paenibacillus sediminis]|uniref:histidine kinase n=1 Tax=Paenibacillus sediminis TaxID=664909 RepID=A0ABS4H376_9BACL|nr:sensor histidine kinase [Paenibacillus sediminis]MBP1936989.1 signal transduction histidine kinase [Paenibacillus sediminis]